MLIQILLLLCVATLLVVFIRSRHGVRLQASKRIGFILFLIANAYAVLRPDDLTRIAHVVGVGRGADLVLYALVAAFTFSVVNFYLRERELKQRITQLARAVALREAELVNRDRGLLPEVSLLTNAVSTEPVVAAGVDAGTGPERPLP
jgi:small membrane protein